MQTDATDGYADRIILGDVLTLDGDNTRAEALAIAGDSIVAVGRRQDILQRRRASTRIHDFGDRVIIPGFNDTHAHVSLLGKLTLRPSLVDCRSIAEVLARVSELARAAKPGEWIVTMPIGNPPFYFDASAHLAEGRFPTRWELDSAAPDNPVYIPAPLGYWGNPPGYAVLNSFALKLNGLDGNSTCDVPGVELQRDDSGELTGIIMEKNMMTLVEIGLLKAVPRFGPQDRLEALRRAIPIFHAKGTTSIYEGHGCAPDVLAGYQALAETGELTLRSGVVVSPTWKTVAEAEYAMRHWLSWARGSGIGNEMLRVSGIFVAFAGPPALNPLLEKDTTDIGWLDFVPRFHSLEEFEAICMLAGEYNLRLHVIASDRLHELVPVLRRVAARYPIGERRWVVEHISKSTRADLQALREMGVGVTLIPIHYLWKAAHAFADLEGEALDLLSPAQALAELGVPVSAGTDAIPNDPLFCLWTMVARQDHRTGRIMGEGGSADRATALRLLTVNGAWLTFDEGRKGPLKPGYFADLAVLSGDPLSSTAEGILDIHCEATMVGGTWVHGEFAGQG